jgi:hypothetical protein
MKLLLYIYTIVLKNDQLAANPVPRAAPTIAGLIPAIRQYNPILPSMDTQVDL